MKIVMGAMRVGKTTELIKRCHKEGGYIVCIDKREANRIFVDAERMGFNINFPITFNDFIKGNYVGINISKFHIDNVDSLLNYMSWSVPISTISFSYCDGVVRL